MQSIERLTSSRLVLSPACIIVRRIREIVDTVSTKMEYLENFKCFKVLLSYCDLLSLKTFPPLPSVIKVIFSFNFNMENVEYEKGMDINTEIATLFFYNYSLFRVSLSMLMIFYLEPYIILIISLK